MGKKSPGTVEAKCQTIAHLYGLSQQEGWGYSIRELCRLFGVNRAWYYQRQRIAARRKKAENEFKAVVEKLVVKFAGYGVRRVTHALKKMGYHLGERRVRRLLKEWGLGWQPL